MKKFKKLIPAFCMLLISAVMLGTTTFAWFSINNEVKATGMNVTAKTNTKFLVIDSDITAGTISTTSTEVAVTNKSGGMDSNTTVYPCARVTESNKDTLNAKNTMANFEVNDWYTANSKQFNNVGTGENLVNVTKIETLTLTNYQITYKFAIGLVENSDTYNGRITVSSDDASTGLDKGITAIVKIGETDLGEIKQGTTSLTSSSNISLSNTKTIVTIILYVNGEHASVTSQGAAQVTGSLNLKITLDGWTIA